MYQAFVSSYSWLRSVTIIGSVAMPVILVGNCRSCFITPGRGVVARYPLPTR